MNSIIIKSDYLKMPKNWENKEATLLFTKVISDIDKQNLHFLRYVTEYQFTRTGTNWYNLKSEPHLLLLFELEKVVFIELKKWDYEIEKFYNSNIGQPFKLLKSDWT